MIEIGDCEIITCEDCPGYKWNGEGSRKDHGYRCDFGAFDEVHEKPERIHFDCPLKTLLDHYIIIQKKPFLSYDRKVFR